MSGDERLDRLEQRLSALETLVRQLLAERVPRGFAPPSIAEPTRGQSLPPAAERQPPATPPREARFEVPRPESRSWSTGLNEQWFGQRGLLAIGVVFLVLAAGYLLKYSFDQGWISPALRCAGGALAGALVGAIGWRLHDSGLKTYGAALIGCGAAIIYVAVWAASRLYGFLPPISGIVGLALVSVSLAAIAFAIDLEALGATATIGAFLAPLVIGRERSEADLLLVYLALMALGLGSVAARKHWRLTTALVALGYFGLGGGGPAEEADPLRALGFAVLGGCAGLYLGLRERWWETRLLAFMGGWALVGVAGERSEHPVTVVVAALLLAAPIWWHGWRLSHAPPTRVPGVRATAWSPGEPVYFLLTPILLGWAVRLLDPGFFDRQPGPLAVIVGAPYLVAGYLGVRPIFALVGTSAAGWAIWAQWHGVPAVWGLLGLAVLWAALDHPLRRLDGRWYALLALTAALVHLLLRDLPERSFQEPAFWGAWALALWGSIAVPALLAGGLLRHSDARDGEVGFAARVLWVVTGALLFFGVTGELGRYFSQRDWSPQAKTLASGLAVSAWWILFAGALVLIGFRRNLSQVRQIGLAVAALTAAKILVYDLSSLSALYRVGSVFIVGLVSLALAYVYHRRSKLDRPG